jgi:hypothetical protein
MQQNIGVQAANSESQSQRHTGGKNTNVYHLFIYLFIRSLFYDAFQ